MHRRLIFIPLLIVFLVLSVAAYEKGRELWFYRNLPSARSDAVNVLLIVMDTVRYDSFSNPDKRYLTPNLNRITAKAMRFENAWPTSSWSLPSQASILTGLYPHEHRADWPDLKLDKATPTLAQFFGKKGYVTGAFSGNAAWITPEYLGRGFHRFDVYTLGDHLRRTVLGRKIGRLLWEFGYHYAGRGKKAPQVNREFLRFLSKHPDRPFFGFICYMDVNQTFHNRKLNHPFWEKEPPASVVFKAYEKGLQELDRNIGDLFEELERRNILKNTLVIITSDHGQSFTSQVNNDHDPWGHGTSLYVEQLKVPLFLLFPNRPPSDLRIQQTVSLQIIPWMVSELCKLKNSPFLSTGSLVFKQQGTNSQSAEIPALATLHYANANIHSLIWNNWHYIKNLDTDNKQKSEELYYLKIDPFEKLNLAPTHPLLSSIRRTLSDILPKRGEAHLTAGNL